MSGGSRPSISTTWWSQVALSKNLSQLIVLSFGELVEDVITAKGKSIDGELVEVHKSLCNENSSVGLHCLLVSTSIFLNRFHVFGIGKRSLGFSVRVEVRKGSSVSEVIVVPGNRTVLSNDNFLRVNLVGDFIGYTSIPSFEDFYLVTPRMGAAGQPTNLGRNFLKWMLLGRVRFTLDDLECNKIGVSYEAYRSQPNFCSTPLWSCLHNQLWHFWEADQNRIIRNQQPQYVVEGRFERISQHLEHTRFLWASLKS